MFAVAGRSMEERVAVTVICWLTAEGWRMRSISLAAAGAEIWSGSDSMERAAARRVRVPVEAG